MKRRKQTNWLVSLYNENKFYVWIVVGIIVLSGVTIGMAIGESTAVPKVLPNDGIDITQNDVETNTKPIEKQDIESDKPKVNNTNKTQNNTSSKSNNNVNVSSNNEENSQQKEVTNEVEKPEEKIVKLEFEMPLEGDIIKNFSENTLVYSNTLEEWVAHTGIDILGEKAMPVKAIEAGTIVEIKEDPRYGYTIIIDHGQGYQSIYCNLSTLDMAHIGKVVEKGQVISGIGDTALFEIKDSPHLHFEITKDGQYIDPLDIISNI